MTACRPAEAETGLQVETVLPRPARGQRRDAEVRISGRPIGPRLPRVTRLMALAIKLQDTLDCGEVRDYAGLAALVYVSRARITQIMNLLHLAPDIQEGILLQGCSAVAEVPTERELRRLVSLVSWTDQRRAYYRQK